MFGSQAQPDQVQTKGGRGKSLPQFRRPDMGNYLGGGYLAHNKQLTVTSCFSGTEWPNMPLTVWIRNEESVNCNAIRIMIRKQQESFPLKIRVVSGY